MSIHPIIPSARIIPLPGLSADELDLMKVVVSPCPQWCDRGEGHPHAVDTPVLRHRSRPVTIDPARGGGDTNSQGRVMLSAQLEQFANRSQPPNVVIGLEHRGDERYGLLSLDEARRFHTELGTLLDTAEAEPDAA